MLVERHNGEGEKLNGTAARSDADVISIISFLHYTHAQFFAKPNTHPARFNHDGGL